MKHARPNPSGSPLSHLLPIGLLALLLGGCAPTEATPLPERPAANTAIPGRPTEPATPVANPTDQPTSTPVSFGPDQAHFPAGINPLTGQPATAPALLKVPALLISISHFPATARPQAGLSFAPYVFEFSITEGQTRHLAAFYGEYPAPEIPIKGECEVRKGAFTRTSTLLGNRVWLDANRNGVQDTDERGIGGICVDLFSATGEPLYRTASDSNGYYGFNVPAGGTYTLAFEKPGYLDFTPANVGDENHDSDVDPASGRIVNVHVAADDLLEDAGMVTNSTYVAPTLNPKKDPKPEVGPVRSGRLLYAYIGNFFQNSCLIYAFASEEVLPLIPKCAFVAHEVSGGGFMLGLDRMKAIAEDNMRKTASRPFDYTSNLYADQPPAGGSAGREIHEFWATLNQSAWKYDPLYQSYLRYVDTSENDKPGILHPEVDRLTGRQLHFENVIVVMTETDVVSPTNLNIHLDQGGTGYAYLFRDGKMFPIRWSTRSGDYEKKTGLRRPIQCINADGSPAPLKPGHTWVTIVTPFSPFKETQPGVWHVIYAAPEGELR